MLFVLTAGLSSGQAVVCQASSVTPIIRAEGLTEYVGDYVLDCTGGTPTAAGMALPNVTFTFTLNTFATSNPTNALTNFSEALLIVDEPNGLQNPSRPVLNCGAPGAPDNGPTGPNTCAIISTGNSADTYDGTANGYGPGAVCDGNGRPQANTYTCGRPNVFQGRSGPGVGNVIQFVVPFEAPGVDDGGQPRHRRFRVTNIRGNAAKIGASPNGLILPSITGSMSAGSAFVIINQELHLGSVTPGISHVGGNATTTESVLNSPIVLREGVESSWMTRNISAYVGDHLGTLSNGSYVHNPFPGWVYNGGTRSPADVAQNVSGAIFNTESGFTWQNNGTNRPPAPNPPVGFGYLPFSNSVGGPFSSAGFGGVDTGISTAGVAQAGTRIAIRFTNIPPGGSVTLPTSVETTWNGEVKGVMALTSTDASGAGPYTPRNGTFTANDNMAVYEVLFSQPNFREDVSIPFTVAGFPEGVQLRGIVNYAPFYSTTEAGQASGALPEPRFQDPCVKLPCLSVFPNSGRTGDPVTTAITVNAALSDEAAAQLLNGAQVKLVGPPQLPDIAGVATTNTGRTITTTFNLAGAMIGPRDVVITPVAGSPTAIPGGFFVSSALPCSYTVGPLNLSPSAAGGSGSLVVSPVPVDCAWSASTNDDWITLGAKQGQLQPYTIAANPLAEVRGGSISIAGKTVSILQQGACTYQVAFDPANKTVPAAGGTINVSITAPAGCAWSTLLTSQNFMHPTTPTSGTGNGVVTISVDPNPGITRYEYLAVPGTPSSVQLQQVSGNCASDVTSQVTVTRGAMLSNFAGTRYTQQVTIKNTSAAPLANLRVGLEKSLATQVAAPTTVPSACGLVYDVAPSLAPGQSATINFQFSPGKSAGAQPPIYNVRVLSF